LLLLQKYRDGSLPPKGFPAFVDVSAIPHQLSLSAARNILMSRAISRRLIKPATVIGFPDDDCWYTQGTLEHIVDQFSHMPGLDLWFCRYSAKPVSVAEISVASKPAGVRDVVRQASSNTLFVRGRVIESGASFDEELGAGTPVGGAEDTEFALRAHMLSRQTMYLDAAVVGHRDKTPQVRAKYYRGGLIAIARYARGRVDLFIELIRKIAVGVWLVLRRELSFTEFLGALSAASGAWRIGGPKFMISDRTGSAG
jgi:hypothetical protein